MLACKHRTIRHPSMKNMLSLEIRQTAPLPPFIPREKLTPRVAQKQPRRAISIIRLRTGARKKTVAQEELTLIAALVLESRSV